MRKDDDYFHTWVERGTARVKCLAQEHNKVTMACRALTWTARSGVKGHPPFNQKFWFAFPEAYFLNINLYYYLKSCRDCTLHVVSREEIVHDTHQEFLGNLYAKLLRLVQQMEL